MIEEGKGPYLSRRRAGDQPPLKVVGHHQDPKAKVGQVGMGMTGTIEGGNMGMEEVKVQALLDLECHFRLVGRVNVTIDLISKLERRIGIHV
jgi:hypothetical protein